MKHERNLGEHAELYALIRGIQQGFIKNRENNKIFIEKIAQIEKFSKGDFSYYPVIDNKCRVVNDITGIEELIDFPTDLNLYTATLKAKEEAKKQKKATFIVLEEIDIINKLKFKTFKSNSGSKADLMLFLKGITGTEVYPVSIKSNWGAAPSILNASKQTCLSYIIKVPTNVKNLISEDMFKLKGWKPSALVRYLTSIGIEFEYINKQSNFELNMGSDVSSMVADLNLMYFQGEGRQICDLAQILKKRKPKINLSLLKNFLIRIINGLRPSSREDEQVRASASSGILEVRNEELIFWGIHDLEEYQNNIFKSAILDTASCSRHDFGYLIKNNEDLLINLCTLIKLKE